MSRLDPLPHPQLHGAMAASRSLDAEGAGRGRSDAAPRRSGRASWIPWLRRVHGRIGLWGALLGLLFGTTGFVLNHRAGPLRISTGEPVVTSAELALPDPMPDSPKELARVLQEDHALPGRIVRAQREPAHKVAWAGTPLKQPEHWSVMIAEPGSSTQIDYWVGNAFVSVKHSDNGFMAMLTNLHKGVGLGIGWVLFIDSFAASLLLLSLTGVVLWVGTHRRRAVAAFIVGGVVIAGTVALLS